MSEVQSQAVDTAPEVSAPAEGSAVPAANPFFTENVFVPDAPEIVDMTAPEQPGALDALRAAASALIGEDISASQQASAGLQAAAPAAPVTTTPPAQPPEAPKAEAPQAVPSIDTVWTHMQSDKPHVAETARRYAEKYYPQLLEAEKSATEVAAPPTEFQAPSIDVNALKQHFAPVVAQMLEQEMGTTKYYDEASGQTIVIPAFNYGQIVLPDYEGQREAPGTRLLEPNPRDVRELRMATNAQVEREARARTQQAYQQHQTKVAEYEARQRDARWNKFYSSEYPGLVEKVAATYVKGVPLSDGSNTASFFNDFGAQRPVAETIFSTTFDTIANSQDGRAAYENAVAANTVHLWGFNVARQARRHTAAAMSRLAKQGAQPAGVPAASPQASGAPAQVQRATATAAPNAQQAAPRTTTDVQGIVPENLFGASATPPGQTQSRLQSPREQIRNAVKEAAQVRQVQGSRALVDALGRNGIDLGAMLQQEFTQALGSK